jgi:hypothetical protein
MKQEITKVYYQPINVLFMNCPYCKKEINAMTGFQELNKFQNHLHSCKKYPKRNVTPAFVDEDGILQKPVNLTYVSQMEALNIRAESGQ